MKLSSPKINTFDNVELYANDPQIEFGIIDAQFTYCFWARGTGKTDGPASYRLAYNAFRMPRSVTGFNGKSYEDMLRNNFPKIIRAWERMGYRENEHYVIGKKAPDSWGWKTPYCPIKSYRNAVQWINGAAISLISLDHAFNQGGDLDAVLYDEVRFFKETQVDELNKSVRGNNDKFHGLHCKGSHLYTTDKPKYPTERWIYDRAGVNDEVRLEMIRKTYEQWVLLYFEMQHAKTEAEFKEKEYLLNWYTSSLNDLRTGLVHVLEADTIQNVHALGADTILNMLKTTGKNEFKRGVLNFDIMGDDFKFYPRFNDKTHTYTATNISYVDGLDLDYKNPEKDCRWDGDWQPNSPFYLGPDWGKRINCLEVAQPFNDKFRIINSFDVLYPKKVKHLVDDFCDYYRFHNHKVVYLYYDHTAIAETGIDRVNYLTELTARMDFRGWKVIPMNIGQAPSHGEKHRFFEDLFGGDRPELPFVEINSNNCSNLITSITTAAAKEDKGVIKKDKSMENNELADQTKTTHHSDAMDTLVYGHLVKFFGVRRTGFMPAATR